MNRITGLVAATHTPFTDSGDLNLAGIERQAEHLAKTGVSTVFIGGTTGECSSLSLDERLALAARWSEVGKSTGQRVIVHVGTNGLPDAKALVAQANRQGAVAVAALAPSYFKPKTLDDLVAWCAAVAAAAPELPFYYYDIPGLTGVTHSAAAFLERASPRIPNLAGVKFTNPDLMTYQQCRHVEDGHYDILWGTDESLIAALAVGGAGAVGSSYNFAAPIYARLMAAFARGDLATARLEQWRSVQLITELANVGYMAAAKAVMGMLGVPVGPARLPHASLDAATVSRLRDRLDAIGFFGWLQ
jgi:N-acetylneuraminate lyase